MYSESYFLIGFGYMFIELKNLVKCHLFDFSQCVQGKNGRYSLFFCSSLWVDLLCKLLNTCITPGWFYYVATTWTLELEPTILAAVLLCWMPSAIFCITKGKGRNTPVWIRLSPNNSWFIFVAPSVMLFSFSWGAYYGLICICTSVYGLWLVLILVLIPAV